MRKVILQEFVTLDSLAAGPNDSVDFVPASNEGDQSFGRAQLAFIDSLDTMLLGRVTYTMFAGYWPNVTSGEDEPFAEKLNALQKIVFSKTLDRAPWGKFEEGTVVRTNPAEEVAKLKQQPGKDMIVWGSLSIAHALIDAKLVDEYRFVVCPLVLGSGRPMFRQSRPLDLKLVSATSYDRGSVQLVYV